MAAFGNDFERAKHDWLYNASSRQSVVLALVFCVLLFLLNAALQVVAGLGFYAALYGSVADLQTLEGENANNFAKASIVGLMPAAVVSAAAAMWLTRFGNAGGTSGLNLHIPKLGWAGWLVVVAGFAITMYAVFIGTFTLLGIDPETYAPTMGGVNDDSSKAGFVEKAIADLSDEPWLFALALPGVTIAVPVAEELIFRGALFSALLRSPAGPGGAVVFTSALWAVIHGASAPWLFVGIIFVMGLVLGLLLLRFGSLWVTIVCHCVWNSLSSLAIFGTQAAP